LLSFESSFLAFSFQSVRHTLCIPVLVAVVVETSPVLKIINILPDYNEAIDKIVDLKIVLVNFLCPQHFQFVDSSKSTPFMKPPAP
jgi:hypothetical protein